MKRFPLSYGLVMVFFGFAPSTAGAQTEAPRASRALIPLAVQLSPDGVSAVVPSAVAVPLQPVVGPADWAASTPKGATRFEVRVDGEPKGVFDVRLPGSLSADAQGADGGTVSVTPVDGVPYAFRVAIDGRIGSIPLTLRPDAPPKIPFSNGYGRLSKGIGSRNEGKVTGAVTYEVGPTTDYLVLDLTWKGTRLFGLIGAKSRTVKMPLRQITEAEWIRKASLEDGAVVLSDRTIMRFVWRVPPNAKDRAKEKLYSVVSGRIVGDVAPADQAQAAFIDVLVRPRGAGLRRVCCYAGSSLSAFLRFERDAGRCVQSRRCSPEEIALFDR